MHRLVRFFKTDTSYKHSVSQYKPTDTWLATVVFSVQMVLYYLMGVLQAKTNIYIGVPVNLFFIALCVFLVFMRKDGLSSLGVRGESAIKSAVTGLVLGGGTVLFVLILGVINGKTISPAHTIIEKFFYYLVIIALPEELVYRGYIQSRLFGLIRNNAAATAITGVMFVLMHIPYHMGASGVGLITYCQNNFWWFFTLFLWHLVFTYLFRRFNSILAPTIFHALLDWSNILLI